jgi:hypothetical protein
LGSGAGEEEGVEGGVFVAGKGGGGGGGGEGRVEVALSWRDDDDDTLVMDYVDDDDVRAFMVVIREGGCGCMLLCGSPLDT